MTPNPAKLLAYDLTFRDILHALEESNGNVGAGYIEHNGSQYLIRAPGQVTTIDELRQVVVARRDNVPIRLDDVAGVALGKELRTGAATQNGEEVVLGTAVMLMGENSRAVSQRVAQRLADIKESLPPGVSASTVYDRTQLVDRTIDTVAKNLGEGALLVSRSSVRLPGQLPRRTRYGTGDPPFHAVHGHRHGRQPCQRQSHEPRRPRFRPHR